MLVPDQQILRGTAATLTWQPTDSTGEPAAPTGAVTVEVVAADGTEILPAGTATAGADANPRTVALTAAQNDQLDWLTATWTDGDSEHATTVEVVGGFYFTVAEARASDASLADTVKYSNALILATRREVEEEFEEICQQAFVPRYGEATLSGSGRAVTRFPVRELRMVRSLRTYTDATTFTSWTAEDLASLEFDRYGDVTARSGTVFARGDRNLSATFEHGHERPPAGIKRAALQRLRARMNEALTSIPDRATSFSVAEGGTYRLDTAGALKTGQPEVDAALAKYPRLPGVA